MAFYAVKAGRVPGIYTTWDNCKQQVIGYKNPIYKKFNTEKEAKEFLSEEFIILGKNLKLPKAYAFVDGSFNKKTNVYGYGGFLVNKDKRYILMGSDNDKEMASMRNVAGEIKGSIEAIKKAIELELEEITILYDYLGIEMWARGKWKRNKEGTKEYYEFIQNIKDIIKIKFIKVKAHTGIPGNEEADLLAKHAVGIKVDEKKLRKVMENGNN